MEWRRERRKLMYVIWPTDPHRHGQDDLWVFCKVSNVTIQGDTFLCCTCFANSQGHTQDGICSEFGWRKANINNKIVYLEKVSHHISHLTSSIQTAFKNPGILSV